MFFKYIKDGITVSVVLDRRTLNKDGKYPVRIKVYHLQKPKYYSTGISMTSEEFEVLERKKSNESIKIRQAISKSFELIKMNVDALADMGDFSFQALALRLGRAVGDTLNNAMTARIKELRDNGKIGSANSFRDTLKAIENFAGKTINFRDITNEWLVKCDKFWEKRAMSITTLGIYFRNIRTMMNFAKRTGMIKESQYPFGKGKFEIKTQEGRKKALDMSQLKAVFNYVDANDTVNKYKDIWCFMYLCNGINPIDMLQLKYSNIIDGEIHFVRQKTSDTTTNRKTIKIFITPEIQHIIDKWGNPVNPDSYIFPFLKGGENPEELKAKNHDVYTRINKRMKTVCEALGIERITTYSARHSFASVMNSEGVPVSYISEQLGHTSIRTTQAYLAGFGRDARAHNARILTSFLSTPGK